MKKDGTRRELQVAKREGEGGHNRGKIWVFNWMKNYSFCENGYPVLLFQITFHFRRNNSGQHTDELEQVTDPNLLSR